MGKGLIIYVVGLGMLLVRYATGVNDVATSVSDNSMEYYARTNVHAVAVAGANIGTHHVLMATDSVTSYTGSFNGGTFTTTVDSVDSTGIKTVRSVATMQYYGRFGESIARDTVIATLRRIVFARYGYFSGGEVNGYMSPSSNSTSGGSMWKVTGDSMFGYAHTNTRWNLGGRPYFSAKVTAFNPPNTMTYGGVYAPVFAAGTQWGITVSRPPANLTRLESRAAASTPSALMTNNDVALTFFPGGEVHVRIPAITGALRNDTVPVSSITSNGIIAVKNGDLRVKGTYAGKFTLVALSGATSTKGNIWIDGDILAATNPRSNAASQDMLGLVAERMAYVTTTDPYTGTLYPRTSASNIEIQAAIYTHRGVFAAENYDTVPVSGRISVYGGIAMNASTSTGVIGGGTLTNGFLKSIRHDPRYLTAAPPGYPVSSNYELISWWEN